VPNPRFFLPFSPKLLAGATNFRGCGGPAKPACGHASYLPVFLSTSRVSWCCALARIVVAPCMRRAKDMNRQWIVVVSCQFHTMRHVTARDCVENVVFM